MIPSSYDSLVVTGIGQLTIV